MRILITGAAGFIGTHLTKYCLSQGHEVHALDQFWSIDHELKDHYWSSMLHRYIIHITRQTEDLDAIFKKANADVCFALHAYASEGRSNHIRSFIHYNNTVSMANVINACVNYKCKLVFTSSVAVYSGTPPFDETMLPNPIDEYGLSKYMSERSIQIAGETQGLDWCIIRPRNVYGPGQNIFDRSRNLFGIWCYNALNNLPLLIYGDGTNYRSFTYIDDIIEPLYLAKNRFNEIINLGSEHPASIRGAAEIFTFVSNYYNLGYTASRHEVKEAFCNIDKSVELLGFKEKTTLYQGLEKMWAWAQTVPMRELDKMPELEVTVNAHSSLK